MPTIITDADFEKEVLKSSLPVLLDFWAPWCGPCRGIAPILEELELDFKDKVRICKINVDENHNIPSQFAIRAIPTLILFNNGQMVDQITGAVAKSRLTELINKVL